MTTAEFADSMLKRPRDFGYFGDLDLTVWGFSPFGVHRDSDALSRSNWRVISEDLCWRFPESTEVMHTSHWACGWYDHLMLLTTDTEALEAALEWVERLESYPVADELDWSDLESADEQEAWEGYARSDFRRALEEWAGVDDLNRSDEQLYELFRAGCEKGNVYWTHDSSGPSIDLAQVVEAVGEQLCEA